MNRDQVALVLILGYVVAKNGTVSKRRVKDLDRAIRHALEEGLED